MNAYHRSIYGAMLTALGTIIKATAVFTAAITILAGCTGGEKKTETSEIKGDLALLQLKGDVSEMVDGEMVFRFGQDGILTVEGARDTVNDDGQKCIVFDEFSEERPLGPNRPYMRIYDSQNRMTEVWTYFGSMQVLEYGDNGRLSSLSWADEGYSGKESYTYDENGILSGCDAHDYGFMEEQDEVSSSDIVAYEMDMKGNWTRRFLLVRDAGGIVTDHHLQQRELHYHSGDVPMDTRLSRLILKGTVLEQELVIGFRQMTDMEEGFCAMMLYNGSYYGASEVSYDFPSLRMTFKRLNGFSSCELKGEFNANPAQCASVTFCGSIKESFHLMGGNFENQECPVRLER